MTFKTIFAAATLAASLGLGCGSASAQELTVRHEKVRFDDLDVTRTAGARAVLERIQAASARVCGPDESPRDLGLWRERHDCMTRSLQDAVAEVGSPIVTAMYEHRPTLRAYELAMTSAAPPVR